MRTKWILMLVCIIVCGVLFYSCSNNSDRQKLPSSEPVANVNDRTPSQLLTPVLLSDHEGVKVYRLWDGTRGFGRYIYYVQYGSNVSITMSE
jgi:hypothetical protein